MTSVPEYPGVPAVVLYREVINSAPSRSVTVYERIKVLNEAGKKYSNIELGYLHTSFFGGDDTYDSSVKDVAGRTIHADGTIIPFNGKPYETTITKVEHEALKEKVFTLPDVQVGSILEYRYTKAYEVPMVPDWILQGDLYVEAAHYQWDEGWEVMGSTSRYALLPKSAQLVASKDNRKYDLTLTDIPPLPTDDFLPPRSTFVYRVMFNVISEKDGEEFWKNTGLGWSNAENAFMPVDSTIKSAVSQLTAGTKTQDEALRKIYARVMELENSDYMRDREAREDKAEGRREVRTASDVLINQRGSGLQLTRLFVTMARGAGIKAYLVRMPDRTNQLFQKSWLSVAQFDSLVVLATVDGAEKFFDPGVADCPYGELPWQYTFEMGMRQTDGNTTFVRTPAPLSSHNMVERVGDLTMDAAGDVDGNVTVKFVGSPALVLRHMARFGDDESFRKDLQSSLKDDLPQDFEVNVSSIRQLKEYEQPLIVTYHIHGSPASKAGKRILMPADLFEARETTRFAEPKREWAVYFEYSAWVIDLVRVKFPENMTPESVPTKKVLKLDQSAMYSFDTLVTANSFTTRRDYARGMIIMPAEKYKEVRDFYQEFEAKDQESVVLKTGS